MRSCESTAPSSGKIVILVLSWICLIVALCVRLHAGETPTGSVVTPQATVISSALPRPAVNRFQGGPTEVPAAIARSSGVVTARTVSSPAATSSVPLVRASEATANKPATRTRTIVSGAVEVPLSSLGPLASNPAIRCGSVRAALQGDAGRMYGIPGSTGPLVVRMGGEQLRNATYPKQRRGNPLEEYAQIMAPASTHATVVPMTVPAERLSRWKSVTKTNPAIIGGFPKYLWAFSERPAWPSSDPNLYAVAPVTYYDYGVGEGRGRCFVRNVLEELSEPGEWVLNYGVLALYLIPPNGSQTVELAATDQPLLELKNQTGVRITDTVFEMTRGIGVTVTDCHDITFERCEFRDLGAFAALVRRSTNVRFIDCWVHDTGSGGFQFWDCGDRGRKVSSGCEVQGCFFERVDLSVRAFANHVSIRGCYDVKVSGSTFSDGRGGYTIYVDASNDCLLRGNVFHNLCFDVRDAGAVYGGRDPDTRGVRVENNTFWKIGNPAISHDQAGVYWDDDGMVDCPIVGNLFVECTHGIKGTILQCEVSGNVFDNCYGMIGTGYERGSTFKDNAYRAVSTHLCYGATAFTENPSRPFYWTDRALKSQASRSASQNPRPGNDRLSWLARVAANR